MRRSSDRRPEIADESAWWRDAVFYQIYVRSFADSNGDGVGDLDGIRSRLGYLELLGVDALWLTPFYTSPMADHGYDVADPRDVDPLFGDLAAFDRLVEEAHQHNLRITVDLVPNHSSDRHEWFQAALQSPPGSPERDRYIFRDGRGIDGSQPPNNWTSVFGGPAWTRVPDGQWYLHLFAPEQPDLNWDNPEVPADLARTLRFWLDRGVDGFRIDVAHGMAKPFGLPDMDLRVDRGPGVLHDNALDPRFDNDGVHEYHRMIRKVIDTYPGRMAVGEIWVKDDERFARYVRPDELHLGFNFRLVEAEFDAEAVRAAIEHSLAAVRPLGTPPTWTLSNHDVVRHVTRYGGGDLGARRARAMALVELALPGVVYLYNGEELGLPNVELPEWALQDPTWLRSGHTDRGRDGCRVPLPWEGAAPPYGFSQSASTWLPQPNEWGPLTAERQLEDPDSMLSLYRQALELRKTHPAIGGDELEWYGAPPGCLAFRRKGGGLICALNTSAGSVPLPPGRVLLASGPMDGDQLPPDTAAWLV
ncbi:glycoside hydrolase family 13 protein [Saccharothrix coeruleofusca]|uniref:Alpha-glucosidase n=1 Tax=Saccharothrix coeruleofusca TaxID=33919 RepID=A0A918EBS5_9PSEU|nr:glycoside hydrolase family 13 protein [Saccharothrix coeruleofusca]MBP2334139.1 alpha-glucosidase [Saccharothrix coeruleofusca]GGP43198.1 alpha-glucosidase [Saccharothrix coeruleofusca]